MKAFPIRRVFLIAVIALTTGLGFFVGEIFAAGDVKHVVISEIQISGETANDEFIELYNRTDSKINLNGWDLKRKTKSGKEYNVLNNIKGIIPARGYFLITPRANCGKNKTENCYAGLAFFDDEYTTNSFLAKHNTILLYDKNENLIDKVGWGEANDFEGRAVDANNLKNSQSIERKSVNGIIQDTDDNSADFFTQKNPNPQNSSYVNSGDNGDNFTNENVSENNSKSNSSESDDSEDSNKADNNALTVYYSKIRINELLPNPKGSDRENEYIELYNYGDKEIDLENWEFKDANILKKGNKKGKKLSGIIAPKKYSAFYKTVSLNNNGDEIKLFNPNGDEIDSVGYGKAKENFSYSFKGGKWEWTPFLTPGEVNRFKVKKSYSHSVYINEILPNPSGEEKLNEYIELYNSGDKNIDLSQWILKDSSKSGKFIFPENSLIKSKKFLAVHRADFKFAMNNSGSETIYFLDPNENIVFSIFYSKAKEDVSYNFNGRGWRWSRFLTPGAENKFNSLPKIEIKKDKKVYKNIYADFKVKISDPDKDKIKVVWDFGDGRKSYKKKTRHKYKETGKYSAGLKVFDGSEEIIKKFKIKVKKFPRPKVRITRLLPNPKGKDSELEWIEIKNKSKKEINLKNWSIATGNSSKKITNHPIGEDFFIRPGKVKKIMRNLSKFSLNNKKCRIELRYPDGKIAYKIKYKREDGVKDDEIYEKMKGGKWQWTKKSVPDVLNVEAVLNVEDDEDVEIVENDEDEEDVEDERCIGGQSLELSGNKELELLAGELRIEKAGNTAAVLGVSAVKRTSGGYAFNSPAGCDKHYALKFLEKLFQEINQTLNNWINLLN
ncbi:lamin tail domain-containing protein [bacterium]|nr:lamin tail domain-containing protein [bacterium]